MSDTIRAAFWMIGAIVAFTSMAIAGRVASLELDTFEIMLYRSIIGLVIVLCIGRIAGTLHQITSEQIELHVIRNVAHFTGQNLWFFALPVLPLAQVFALEFTTPIWVILLAPLFLKERITQIGVLAALLGFVGVMLVVQPGRMELSPALFAAAGAAVGFAITAIFTRKLTQTQSITCIMFWLTGLQALFGLLAAGYDGAIAFPSSQTLPWIILIGLAGLLAHFCMTTALSLAPASIVMPIDFIRLPVIAIVASFVYAEALDPLVFVGAIIIFGANYMNISFGSRPQSRSVAQK